MLHSRDLKDAEAVLQAKYLALEADFYATTGRRLFITCTWRSAQEQQRLYARGRTEPGSIVTHIDGVTSRSRHNFYPSQAIDVCVDDQLMAGKEAIADWNKAHYEALGPLAIKHGLVWGGSFSHLCDYPHLELPADWTKETT